MDRQHPLHIIVGGGIGGMTAALALLRAGRNVRVFEQSPVLAEVGAGLTLARGAMQCLIDLGIGETVRHGMAFTAGFPFLHYKTGAMLAGTPPVPLDAELQLPEPGGGGHIFRADLHKILAAAVRDYGDDRIVLGARLETVRQDDASVTACFAGGEQITGAALIGADGVRSVVREAVFGEPAPPQFTGKIAYRFLVPGAEAKPLLGVGGRACLFVGFGKVFNRYLIANDRYLNCVGLLKSENWTREGWNSPATVDELLAEYGDWHPDVVELMRRAPAEGLIKWGIFSREPTTRWVEGRVALLGDAVHPMQPFLGLGAAMAIEDGAMLARAMLAKESIEQGLQAYQRIRIPRANHVMELSRLQGELFDTTDPAHYPPPNAPAHDPDLAMFDPAAVII